MTTKLFKFFFQTMTVCKYAILSMKLILTVLLTLLLFIMTVIVVSRSRLTSESYSYKNFSGIYPGWVAKNADTDNGKSMIFPSLYDPVEEATRFCNVYGRIRPPQRQEDCPDSSFDFVDAQHMNVYVGQNAPSCMQLRALNYPNCYSKEDGTFTPWWFAFQTTSP